MSSLFKAKIKNCLTCICDPKIYYISFKTKICFIEKKIDNFNYCYVYDFDNETFLLLSMYLPQPIEKQFNNIKLQSSKEFIDFGDRIINLKLFL